MTDLALSSHVCSHNMVTFTTDVSTAVAHYTAITSAPSNICFELLKPHN